MSLSGFVVALDLGQVSDPTALCVLERMEQPVPRRLRAVLGWLGRRVDEPAAAGFYQVIHLERLALGTSYTDIPPRLHHIEGRLRQEWLTAVWEEERQAAYAGPRAIHHPTLADAPVDIVIDQTGVGRPVLDLFRSAGLDVLGITITGGDASRWVSGREAHVAKRHLVSVTQALMQSKRVKAAASLPDWPVLRAELKNFRAKISLSGNATFEAGPSEEWRDGAHDDLVLSLALGLWAGEELARRGQAATFEEIAAAWQW